MVFVISSFTEIVFVAVYLIQYVATTYQLMICVCMKTIHCKKLYGA